MVPGKLLLPLRLPRRLARRVHFQTIGPDPEALARLDLPLWVACAWEQHATKGLFGACDTRLGGALTRQLQGGYLSLARGEVGLVGGGPRLGRTPLLVAGLGTVAALDAAGAAGLGRDLAERIHLLGHAVYGLEPPVGGRLVRPLMAFFMTAHLHRRLALLGSAKGVRVTWILPPGVQPDLQVAGGGAGRSPRRGRCQKIAGRPRRDRRVTFLRGPRKK